MHSFVAAGRRQAISEGRPVKSNVFLERHFNAPHTSPVNCVLSSRSSSSHLQNVCLCTLRYEEGEEQGEGEEGAEKGSVKV